MVDRAGYARPPDGGREFLFRGNRMHVVVTPAGLERYFAEVADRLGSGPVSAVDPLGFVRHATRGSPRPDRRALRTAPRPGRSSNPRTGLGSPTLVSGKAMTLDDALRAVKRRCASRNTRVEHAS
jgi:hypothetical protein